MANTNMNRQVIDIRTSAGVGDISNEILRRWSEKGYNMAVNKAKQSSRFIQAIETTENDIVANNRFETYISLKDVVEEEDNETKIQRIAILEREIRYLPEPCETILKDFYYGGFSMTEIMSEIHYQSTDSVKAMKNRCMNKLRERIKLALGMLDR